MSSATCGEGNHALILGAAAADAQAFEGKILPKGLLYFMDDDLLATLLRGGHVNMAIRKERGMWPHPKLQLEELVAHLAWILEQNRWFPREWVPAKAGSVVQEGGFIERVGLNRFVYRAQRHRPDNPTAVAEITEREFSTAADAARHYLRWDLSLPGSLDGYEVVD